MVKNRRTQQGPDRRKNGAEPLKGGEGKNRGHASKGKKGRAKKKNQYTVYLAVGGENTTVAGEKDQPGPTGKEKKVK